MHYIFRFTFKQVNVLSTKRYYKTHFSKGWVILLQRTHQIIIFKDIPVLQIVCLYMKLKMINIYLTVKFYISHQVHVDGNMYMHMIVCNCTHNKPELRGYQPDHTLEDELKIFPSRGQATLYTEGIKKNKLWSTLWTLYELFVLCLNNL